MTTIEQVSDWYTSDGRLYSVCPECGGSISDEKRKCVDCSETAKAPCEVCDEWIPANSFECPECGSTQEDVSERSLLTLSKNFIVGGLIILGLFVLFTGFIIPSSLSVVFYLFASLFFVGGVSVLIMGGLLGKALKSGESDDGPGFITDMDAAGKKVRRYQSKKSFKQDLENLDRDDIEQLSSAASTVADAGSTAVEGYKKKKEKQKNLSKAKEEAKDAISHAKSVLENEDYVDDQLQAEIESAIENVNEKMNESDADAEKVRSASDTLLKKVKNKKIEINKKSYGTKLDSVSTNNIIWEASCPSNDCIRWGKIRERNIVTSGKTENVGFTVIDRTEFTTLDDQLKLQCEECSETMTISADQLGE